MSFWNWLTGKKTSRKRSKKRAQSKTLRKKSVKGLKHFVIFDKYENKKLSDVTAKTENQALNKFFDSYSGEQDGVRIMSKRRWESEQS